MFCFYSEWQCLLISECSSCTFIVFTTVFWFIYIVCFLFLFLFWILFSLLSWFLFDYNDDVKFFSCSVFIFPFSPPLLSTMVIILYSCFHSFSVYYRNVSFGDISSGVLHSIKLYKTFTYLKFQSKVYSPTKEIHECCLPFICYFIFYSLFVYFTAETLYGLIIHCLFSSTQMPVIFAHFPFIPDSFCFSWNLLFRS